MSGLSGIWLWRGVVTAVSALLIFLYLRGWRKNLQPSIFRSIIPFLAGLTILFIVLATPLHQLAAHYFFVHTAQHLLLIAWIPALLLASDPLPVLVAGLPDGLWARWRDKRPSPAWQSRLRFLTAPGTVWLMFICNFWLWYDPTFHQATLEHSWVRGIEVSSLLATAGLYWWHITGCAPHWHNQHSLIGRIAFTFVATMPIKIVGLILLFTPETTYTYPQQGIAGIIFDAEQMGGMMVWALGGVVFAWTAVYLARQWLGSEDDKPVLPGSLWDTQEAMLAPGINKPTPTD